MLKWRSRNDMDAVRRRLVDSWRDDLHAYDDTAVPHKATVAAHMPGARWNLAYCDPPNSSNDEDGQQQGGDRFQAGHLVVLECPGRSDPAALLAALTLDDYLTFEKHNMEHKSVLLDRLSRERGYLVKIVSVRDMAGLGTKHSELSMSFMSFKRETERGRGSIYTTIASIRVYPFDLLAFTS